MPVATLAEALPYVNWITLVSLGVGAFWFVGISGAVTDATPGYLRFTGLFAAMIAAIALASDAALPVPTQLVTHAPSAQLDAARRVALMLFVGVVAAYSILVARPAARRVLGVAGAVLGALLLLAAAFGWAPRPVDAVPLSIQLASLGMVTGGSVAAITLGHWYLVTPRLSETTLIVQIRLLLASLVVQAMLFLVWSTLGGGVGQGAWAALAGPAALLVILRGLITVAFPLVLTFMALRTAQTRSMESSTGLLYINLAAVLAGTIGASALYVSGGILI